MFSRKSSRAWWLILIPVIGGFFYQVLGSPTQDTESPASRIAGGTVTEKHEFPSMVTFCSQIDEGCSCGGIIIFSEWVLTAAHCEVRDISRARIYAGLQKQSEKDDADVQERSIVEFKGHENFQDRTGNNDIALLKVSPPFEFNDYVKPAYLPDGSCRANANFGKLWAVGWGKTASNGQSSDDLLKVDVPVIDDEKCKPRIPPRRYNETKICAGYPEGGKNACPGDSGGPLYQINGESHVVLGVTSQGGQCGASSPVLYTEVAYYIDWIDQITNHGDTLV